VTIGKSIRVLLTEGKTVILPGFGNLKIQQAPKGSPVSGGKLPPPGLRVVFDASFSKDNGTLALHLSEHAAMDYEEARQRVLEQVDAIRFALDKGEACMLAGAGEFRRDDDGKVHFSPEKDWMLDPGQYGLEALELTELGEKDGTAESKAGPEEGREDAGEKAAAVTESADPGRGAPASAQDGGKRERKPPPYTVPVADIRAREEEKSHRKTRLWRVIWIVASILVVVLALLLFIPADKMSFLGGGKQQPDPALLQHAPAREEAVDETPALQQGDEREPLDESAAGPEGEQDAGEQEIPAIAPEEVDPAPVMSEKYYLIAGSFRNVVNASELQDKLNQQGYEAVVIATENRMYRVSVAAFSDKREAERELYRLKTQPGLQSLWLLANE
jgi:cell division septation protein DedD/nucleoid DNA-binding protein